MRCIVSNRVSSETADFRHRARLSSLSASEAEREPAWVMIDLSCLIIENATAMMKVLDIFDLWKKKVVVARRLKRLAIE